MKKEGGCEWYQSMGHIFLYISANFLPFFKGPRPFKSQKTFFSGLTTQYAPRLNRGTSAAKKRDSGWVLAWIFLDSGSNLFQSRPIFMRFFFQFSWIFYSKIYTVIITVKTGTLVDFLHVQFTDSMPYWCHSKYVRRKEYTVFKLRLHI